MFDFVQPRFAGWRVRGFGGQAGGDEAGRYAIHTLLIAYKRMRRGQSLVVWAIREGRQAAHAVDKFLMGSTTLPR